MPPTLVPGFITKKETAELFQRSHRQLTRDLADAMKVQNPKVLDNCRLRTEDGETRQGIGITPELLDQLRTEGKNPVWYLRTSWLEKTYGGRGRGQRRDQRPAVVFAADAEEGTDAASRPDLVHVLRERIRGLEADKQDLRDEMKIKNQQIADRVEREKETNALIRDLHTLMADSQRRLLPPIQVATPQGTDGYGESLTDARRPTEAEVIPPAKAAEKGSRRQVPPRQTPTEQQPRRKQSRRKLANKGRTIAKNDSPVNAPAPASKSKSLWSRLFPH
jgi:hypothetical protein